MATADFTVKPDDGTWVCLNTNNSSFRITRQTLDTIMGQIRTATGGTPIVHFKDIFGNDCWVNMGHATDWHQTTPEGREAEWEFNTLLELAYEKVTEVTRMTNL